MAVSTRGGKVSGVIFHSARGSQYTAADFADLSRSWDPPESRSGRIELRYCPRGVVPPLEREWTHGRSWWSKTAARTELFEWLAYCNLRRRSQGSAGLLCDVA
ncbi:hypothetical protein Pd630_LPD16164 (plasmid) [Rhodococcus opacus PD630]|nr:hypothetical protein Pd630_LPD16164 [Rhodococcus opacus PD630]